MSGAPPVLAPPERVADDRRARAAATLVVGGAEEAAAGRRHAEHLEEVAADEDGLRVSDLAARGEIETHRRPRQHAGERLLVGPEPLPLRVGQLGISGDDIAGAWLGAGRPHLHELARVPHRERPQAHDVEQLEDRGVGADSQHERQQGHRREGAVVSQPSRRVAEVLPDGLDKGERVHLVDLFANPERVSQPALRGPPGLVGRHAARDELVGLDLEVRLELPRPFGVPSAAAEEARPSHAITRWRA